MKDSGLTAQTLRDLLGYNPETGVFVWLQRVSDAVGPGRVAGTSAGTHRQIVVRGRTYAASQLAWLYVTGEWPADKLSFKNGNPMDVRFANLSDRSKVRDRNSLSAERVRDVLSYDAKSGSFAWLSRPKQKRTDTILVGKGGDHASIKIDGSAYAAQRIAWLFTYGEFPSGQIAPVNGNARDLRIENWRLRRQPDATRKAKVAARNKAWREQNPLVVRATNLRLSFGITIEQYNEMLVAQGGMCDICGQPPTMERHGKVQALCVDHCHQTGKVRSLLCHPCNSGLGAFRDSPERLRSAIAYLRRHAGVDTVVPLALVKDAT